MFGEVTYGAVMPFYVVGFVELRENGFREDFAKLNAHLICAHGSTRCAQK